MTRALVIGLGNEWRGDDGVGPWVVSALRAAALPQVATIPAAADGLALLDAWRDADRVYVIDALRGGGAPGTVARVDALHETLPTAPGYSSHAFGLAEAIELGRTLGTLPRQLIVIAIEGCEFAMGAPLSPAVAAAAQRVLAQLRAELTDLEEEHDDA